jgi:hypothetical protein
MSLRLATVNENARSALECGREAAAFLSGDLANYKIRRPNGGALPVYDDAITPRNCDFGKRRQLRDRTPKRWARWLLGIWVILALELSGSIGALAFLVP